MEMWNGFRFEKTTFEDRELWAVYPDKPNGRWLLKTEYFGAFPNAEIELVKQGYHLFHISNKTRWHEWDDTDARARFAEFVHKEYGLAKKCVIVGMSCGGMQGIYFAAKYPQYVSCLYLDAPVVNLLSCPAGMGRATSWLMKEFVKMKKMDVIDLMGYREHPLDFVPQLVKNNIPTLLIAGDADFIVPYDENGKYVNDAYVKAGATIETIIKPDCGHHPHGLEDPTPIIEFVKKYDKD
ncbi:MAG: alpha/beta hydrolase [Oscillospiraceae bacterium]|nr:alpha/beta hydrolase [Oscillospiraceae bacterium]